MSYTSAHVLKLILSNYFLVTSVNTIISMLSRSSGFVHYFSECGLIFAT